MLLNPLMAWIGAFAVSVPIIIHLLNKRKFERVVWAAMRFLRLSVEQNQRRMRIEDLLLLALRCLLLLLLGLALARPTIRSLGAGGWLGQAKVTSVVLLDNSYSMSAADGAKSRFENAKEAAVKAIDSLPAGSSVAVLLASDATPSGPIPEPTFDLDLARRTVRDAKVCDRSTNLYPAVKTAVDTLKNRRAGAREIYLVTDTQALGWKQFTDIRNALEEVRREVRAHVVRGQAVVIDLGGHRMPALALELGVERDALCGTPRDRVDRPLVAGRLAVHPQLYPDALLIRFSVIRDLCLEMQRVSHDGRPAHHPQA